MDLTIRAATLDELALAISIDDDACTAFEAIGLKFDLTTDHPFAKSEYRRWARAAAAGHMFFAAADEGPVGLLVLGTVAGELHLEQLSVRRAKARRGIGTRLLRFAMARAGERAMWLETYGHVPWNRPFYERHGFAVVPESEAPAEVAAALAEQRKWLPAPEQRVAMYRPAGAPEIARG